MTSFRHLFSVLSQDFAYVRGCGSVYGWVEAVKSSSRIETFFSCLYWVYWRFVSPPGITFFHHFYEGYSWKMETVISHFVLVSVQSCENVKNKKHWFLSKTIFPFVIFIRIVCMPSIYKCAPYKLQKIQKSSFYLGGKTNYFSH